MYLIRASEMAMLSFSVQKSAMLRALAAEEEVHLLQG